MGVVTSHLDVMVAKPGGRLPITPSCLPMPRGSCLPVWKATTAMMGSCIATSSLEMGGYGLGALSSGVNQINHCNADEAGGRNISAAG